MVGNKYVGVQVTDVAGVFVLDGDDDVHRLPRVHHHIPRIAVQSVRPVVVALPLTNWLVSYVGRSQMALVNTPSWTSHVSCVFTITDNWN